MPQPPNIERTVTGPKDRRVSTTCATNSGGFRTGYRCPKMASRDRAPADNGAMLLDADQCYRALRAHDSRFDGRFFVGVSSTRIYCRPVCTVRTPLRHNCTFYASAAAAEA